MDAKTLKLVKRLSHRTSVAKRKKAIRLLDKHMGENKASGLYNAYKHSAL